MTYKYKSGNVILLFEPYAEKQFELKTVTEISQDYGFFYRLDGRAWQSAEIIEGYSILATEAEILLYT